MNEESPEEAVESPAGINKVLVMSAAVAAAVAVLLAIISMVIALSLSGDVSHLEAQMRKVNKTNKAMEAEMADLKSAYAKLATSPSGEVKPKLQSPKPTHMDAADPARDCVVRPGSKNPLEDCMR